MKFTHLFFFLGLISYAGISQKMDIDRREIESLIREWDYANNSRSEESFQRVYNERLLFYTQRIPESKAIELKQKVFENNPDFRQRISSNIRYTPYTTGIVKCDFTKEVRENLRWKSYPSYLLVSYRNRRYQIVGESDYATDKALRYRLDIGEPIKFETSPAKPDTKKKDTVAIPLSTPHTSPDSADSTSGFSEALPLDDSTQTLNASSGPVSVDSADSSLSTDSPLSVDTLLTADASSSADQSFKLSNEFPYFPPLSSMGFVTIPRGYIFILIAILAVGGLMIFVAGSIQERKRRKRMHIHESDDEADHVIHDFKIQSVFETFVITLFDPLYFRYRRPKTERVLAGKFSESKTESDFEFEFVHKEIFAQFAIKCLYFKNTATRAVQLFSPEHWQSFRHFEEESEIPLYFILGIGGTPDDPKELYLVPAQAIRSEYMSKGALRPYSKSGMFFFNSSLGRLQ